MKNSKVQQRKQRHLRIRAKLSGTSKKPRMVVFRSLKKNYVQLVDDTNGKILAAASNVKSPRGGTKSEEAKKVGLDIAKKAIEKGITTCVFDRNGYKYHGRVKAIADGAREGGLKF